mgnify:CR=1 FL=1
MQKLLLKQPKGRKIFNINLKKAKLISENTIFLEISPCNGDDLLSSWLKKKEIKKSFPSY